MSRAARIDERPRPVIFSDATLREGDQMPGSLLDAEGKVELARALRDLGVASVDAGFPANSERELAAMQRVADEVDGIIISGLARARKSDIDAVALALAALPPERRAVTVFLGSSPVHRRDKLDMDVDQLEAAVRASVTHAVATIGTCAFSPEDATRTEPEVLVRLYRAALESGARVLGYTDTVGIATPEDVRERLGYLFDELPGLAEALFAVHFHDDLGLAVANTVAGIDAGADIAQVALNGVGERAGNASLEETAMCLDVHVDRYQRPVTLDLPRLYDTCRLGAAHTGPPTHLHKALVGENIYRTEAGVHQDGILKNPATYLPWEPDKVGGPPLALVLGPSSGRAAFERELHERGISLPEEQFGDFVRGMKNAHRDQWRDVEVLIASKLREVNRD
jgi:2-isopropylmalate synthase